MTILEDVKAQAAQLSPEQIKAFLLKIKADRDKHRARFADPEIRARQKAREKERRVQKKAFMQEILKRAAELGITLDSVAATNTPTASSTTRAASPIRSRNK